MSDTKAEATRRGLLASATGLLDGGVLDAAENDADGLDAYFAREVASGGRTRSP